MLRYLEHQAGSSESSRRLLYRQRERREERKGLLWTRHISRGVELEDGW